MTNWYSWYRPIDKQIILETREKLIEIAKPDPATLKLLSIIKGAKFQTNTKPKSKLVKDSL